MIARRCNDCDKEAAITSGVLVLDGNCLYLDHPEFGAFTVLWPFGRRLFTLSMVFNLSPR